jgi:hypothetical protein
LGGQTFFFYGSLMDLELLEAVLGRKAHDLTLSPGWLKGYVAETAARYSFPTLVENHTGRVDGILAQGLTEADVERIAYFEDEEYTTIIADISTAESDVAAHVYVATKRLKSSGTPWNFDDWRKHDKPLLLAVTRKVMAEHYGMTPINQIDAVWHHVKTELEAQMHAPVTLKARRPSQTTAPTQARPRRATRAASPTRPPRGS